ncbi:MAG: diadenylate cyclase CdaA [Lachnospiraceae bacterium]|nr:diadenylate cyclase CdaA [Lachnospiraceae bacterium]
MEYIKQFLELYFDWLYIPQLHISDIVEIILIAFVIYEVVCWFQKTRAWTLLKGILVVFFFMALSSVLQFNTILWILQQTLSIGIIAIIVLFQPEFRRALEQLGRKGFVSSMIGMVEQKDTTVERITNETISEVAQAAFEMSKTRTGALIVFEQKVALGEYESTGISIDACVSSQLLINIFEKNTPLHDGAVIVRNNRVVCATCYLPLSDNYDINKNLGTRHRAAIGISEVSDSLTLIVSEETGAISIADGGKLIRNLDVEGLKKQLKKLQQEKNTNKRFKLWKGRKQNEAKTSQ